MNNDDPDSAEEAAVPGVDTTRPSIARVYDAVLGGRHNYPVDRAVADQLREISPVAFLLPRDNRGFLVRAVRYMTAHVGIDQFLDCGSGLPTVENTHEVATAINPDARVLYVDNDPVVIAEGRAILSSSNSEMLDGDISRPEELLKRDEVRTYLDWSRPIGLLHVGVLHHILGDRVFDVAQTYLDAMPNGSHVAISHFYNPGDDSSLAERAAETEAVLLGGDLQSGEFRNREQIERLFCGWPLIEPGLSALAEWWPDGPPGELTLGQRLMLAGVAASPRKVLHSVK